MAEPMHWGIGNPFESPDRWVSASGKAIGRLISAFVPSFGPFRTTLGK